MPRSLPTTHNYDHEPEQTALPPCDPAEDCDCCCEEVLLNDYSMPFVGNTAKYVALPVASADFAFAADESFSVSFWMKFSDGVHSAATGCVITRTGWVALDGQLTGWQVNLTNLGAIDARMASNTFGSGGDPNAYVQRVSAGTYLTAQWHHVVVTYDGTFGPDSISIYVDGALDNGANNPASALTGTTVPASNVIFEMGRSQDVMGNPTFPLDLYVDELAIWGKELSPYDVSVLRGAEAKNSPCVPAIPVVSDGPVHCPSDLMLWYRFGDDPTDKLLGTTASPGGAHLEDASGHGQDGVPTGYEAADFFVIDCPPKCSCTSALGGDNPNTWTPDPRSEYIVTYPAETGVNTATPATWDSVTQVTNQRTVISMLSTQRMGTGLSLVPQNAATPGGWAAPNPGVGGQPQSYRGWDATIDLASLQAAGQGETVFAFDAKTTEVSWYHPHTNTWTAKANLSGNPCQGAGYPVNPGLLAMPAVLPGGASVGVVVKTCGDTAALHAGFSFYDPAGDSWNVLNNAPHTFHPGTCLAADPLCDNVPARNFIWVGEGNSTNIWLYDCATSAWAGLPLVGPTGNHVLKPGSSMALDPWTGNLYVIWWHGEGGPAFELWRNDYGTPNWTQLASPPLIQNVPDLYIVPCQKMHVAVHKQASGGLPEFSLFVASSNGTHWSWYRPGLDIWVSYGPVYVGSPWNSPERYKTGAATTILRRQS